LSPTIFLKNPVALAASKEFLFAISTNKLVELDTAAGNVRREIATLEGRPSGLAVSEDGSFYVSDAAVHGVRVLDKAGKQIRVIGAPGGVKDGAYDPKQLHNPAGLTLAPDGHLWVTESERWKPKRLAAFDANTGEMWKEFFGPTAYGASNSGFDPADATRWFGHWARSSNWIRRQKRAPRFHSRRRRRPQLPLLATGWPTFAIACGKATYIEELLPNNTLKPLAMLSTAHLFSYAHDWHPPHEFAEAFTRDYSGEKYATGVPAAPTTASACCGWTRMATAKCRRMKSNSPPPQRVFPAPAGATIFNDLTLRVPANFNNKTVLVTLKPDGFWPGGAPKYPALNDAIKAGIPIDLPNPSAETTTDRFGNMLVNSDPAMRAFAPNGRVLWSYPNRWSGVHGSHNSPLRPPANCRAFSSSPASRRSTKSPTSSR